LGQHPHPTTPTLMGFDIASPDEFSSMIS